MKLIQGPTLRTGIKVLTEDACGIALYPTPVFSISIGDESFLIESKEHAKRLITQLQEFIEK